MKEGKKCQLNWHQHHTLLATFLCIHWHIHSNLMLSKHEMGNFYMTHISAADLRKWQSWGRLQSEVGRPWGFMDRYYGCSWYLYGQITTKWLKIDIYSLWQKCSPKNLVFSDLSFTMIFADIIHNKCIIHRHLRGIQFRSAVVEGCYSERRNPKVKPNTKLSNCTNRNNNCTNCNCKPWLYRRLTIATYHQVHVVLSIITRVKLMI